MKYILIILIAVNLTACRNTQLPDIHLEAKIAQALITDKQLVDINFCDKKLLNFDWDSIVVVNPYCDKTSIRSLAMKNYNEIDDLMKLEAEGYVTVFFIKDKYCIAYSNVLRSIVDLSTLEKDKGKCFALITKRNCIKKIIYRTNEKWISIEDL